MKMTSSDIIDLRSDTVTRPTKEMRQAMAAAEVGDDVFGDDPTINRLQEQVADLFGKEAAIFLPSGTMANQVAIKTHTQPGNEIICHKKSHIYSSEGGAACAISGCSLALLEGEGGIFSASNMIGAIRPDDQHCPRSSLVVVENTHNTGGGTAWALGEIGEVCSSARARGLKTHLDGARIMNACIATGTTPALYAEHFDSATICFSKGLGAPVGSALAGSKEFIARAKRFRKMMGGTMRQAGILAAAAIYALDHNVQRLADDHANAALLVELLSDCSHIAARKPETNLVFFEIDPNWGSAKKVQEEAARHGIWVIAMGPQIVRAAIHLHIDGDDINRAAKVLGGILS